MPSKANLLTWVMVKESTVLICRVPNRMHSLCAKDLNSLMTFEIGFLKATYGVRAAEGMTFF